MGAGIRICANTGIQGLQSHADEHNECYHAEAVRLGELA